MFVTHVNVDSETLNGWSHHHRQLLDDNLKWQKKVEEMIGCYEQCFMELETNDQPNSQE